MTTFTASGKPKWTIASLHVANILWHLPFGRELMHLGLQTMAHRHLIPHKYRPDITDREWDKLDGTLPDPAHFADLPGGACGANDGDAISSPASTRDQP